MAKILIADDRATDRLFLVTLLGYQGHTLLEAADGRRSLELVRSERPDLVICDLLMPGMDGFEFLRQLRADPAVARTPVILYTATYRDGEARALGEAAGVARLMAKPAEPEAILAAVAGALGGGAPAAPLTEEYDRKHLQVVNEKLYEKAAELEASNRRLAALLDVGNRLAAEHDPRRLVDHVCAAARDLLGAAGAAVGLFGVEEFQDGRVRPGRLRRQLHAVGATGRDGLQRLAVLLEGVLEPEARVVLQIGAADLGALQGEGSGRVEVGVHLHLVGGLGRQRACRERHEDEGAETEADLTHEIPPAV